MHCCRMLQARAGLPGYTRGIFCFFASGHGAGGPVQHGWVIVCNSPGAIRPQVLPLRHAPDLLSSYML